MSKRYALYWAPKPDSALWRTGCAVLGRDAATGETLPQPKLSGLDDPRFKELTASPRLYGLHATLKPPFRLAPGSSEDKLRERLEAFVAKRRPFRITGMALAPLSRFLALVPHGPSVELDLLARDCVDHFDCFRAPFTQAELDKRRSCELTSRQETLLSRWGYPYVMEEYRFHITLTGSVQDSAERESCLQGLTNLLGSDIQEELSMLEIWEICLFEQPRREEPFRITGRYPFGGQYI